MDVDALSRRIEHAVLSPQATIEDVADAAKTAVRLGVRALVVKPCHLRVAANALAGSDVKVVTVIGFPHGGQTTETKIAEAREAIRLGAHELDMVLNIGALRGGDLATAFHDIYAVVEAADGRRVKVILETAYLDNLEKYTACRLAVLAGAAYVKTSTGFAPQGATVADVALMRRAVDGRAGVKAAGGIRSYADAAALLAAGADLLGTSHSEAILTETTRAAA